MTCHWTLRASWAVGFDRNPPAPKAAHFGNYRILGQTKNASMFIRSAESERPNAAREVHQKIHWTAWHRPKSLRSLQLFAMAGIEEKDANFDGQKFSL
jgi:hypothetical protein